MATSPMPNPRDYPDPIGYAVASADWWRARVHVTSTTRKVFSAPTAQTLAFAVAGAICGLAIVGLTCTGSRLTRLPPNARLRRRPRDARFRAT